MELNDADFGRLVSAMETAWNSGDAHGYVSRFQDDADFIVINGQHLRGRAAILAVHEQIFSSIYAGSVMSYQVEHIRRLTDDAAVVYVRARLQVPTGPLAGEICARPTLTLVARDGDWRIASLQNTQIKDLAPPQAQPRSA